MTPQNVKDFVEQIIGESFSDDNFLSWLNKVNRKLMSLRLWGLKEYKQAYTTSESAQALPTNCELITKVGSSDGMILYNKITFNEQDFHDSDPFSYWIDQANNTITFGSDGASVNVYYTKQAIDLTMSSTFPIPSQFHDIYTAGFLKDYFTQDDDDDTTLRKAEAWVGEYAELLRDLIDYDAQQQCNSTEASVASDDYLISNGIIPR